MSATGHLRNEISEETRVPLKFIFALAPVVVLVVGFYVHNALANAAQDRRTDGLEAQIGRLQTITCKMAEGQHLLIPECDERDELRNR